MDIDEGKIIELVAQLRGMRTLQGLRRDRLTERIEVARSMRRPVAPELHSAAAALYAEIGMIDMVLGALEDAGVHYAAIGQKTAVRASSDDYGAYGEEVAEIHGLLMKVDAAP